MHCAPGWIQVRAILQPPIEFHLKSIVKRFAETIRVSLAPTLLDQLATRPPVYGCQSPCVGRNVTFENIVLTKLPQNLGHCPCSVRLSCAPELVCPYLCWYIVNTFAITMTSLTAQLVPVLPIGLPRRRLLSTLVPMSSGVLALTGMENEEWHRGRGLRKLGDDG